MTLASDRTASPRYATGVGDTSFAVKYNFLEERENSRLPALTVSAYVQVPTGDENRGLGSGVTDFGLNAIAQRTFKEKNIVRLNLGYVASGNTVSGALGISAVR